MDDAKSVIELCAKGDEKKLTPEQTTRIGAQWPQHKENTALMERVRPLLQIKDEAEFSAALAKLAGDGALTPEQVYLPFPIARMANESGSIGPRPPHGLAFSAKSSWASEAFVVGALRADAAAVDAVAQQG